MLQDLCFGLRILRRNPAFSAAAIFIVALGIAATCVILSFAEAAVFRALPYRDPSRLVSVTIPDPKAGDAGGAVSVPVFLSWREHARQIGQFAVTKYGNPILVGGSEPQEVFAESVSQGGFRTLAVPPILGRSFSPSDYKSDAAPVAILSYGTWQSLFNSRHEVVGRSVLLDGVSTTIIGVMPPGFLTPESFGTPCADWTPATFTAKDRSDLEDKYLMVWGRLNSEVSIQQAQAALGALANQVMNPPGAKQTSNWRVEVTPLIHNVVKQWRSALIMLFSAVGFLLATSCVNLANLLLARAGRRQKEIALRVAVGATRGRVIRQLLTESALLGCFGGGLGTFIAHWAIKLEGHFLPAWFFDTANFQQMGIDSAVLLVTVAVSIVSGIIFGTAPALHASKVNLVQSLKESPTLGRGRAKVQTALVIAEVALSLVLLVGAGLLLRSFLKLEGVHPGFNSHEVLTMGVPLPQYQYHKKSQQIAAYREILVKIESLPGVQSAAFVTPLPLTGINGTITIPAQPSMANPDHSQNLYAVLHAVSPGYFKAMGIPLLRGRTFTAQDNHSAERFAMVNEAFAHLYWPGQNAVGKEFFKQYPKTKPVTRVIGVVGNTKESDLWGPPAPVVYWDYAQQLFAAFAGTVIAKTRTPASTAVAMEKVVHSVDPQAPISQIRTMDEVLAGARAGDRFYLLLVGVFAVLALILAAVGIASTVSYAVSQRRHEIGIRMALGAERSVILRLVIGETLWLVLIGVAVGVAGSLALTRFVASQLYGVTATDPLTFIAVSALFTAVCLVATFIPAIRATSINPAETLRTS